MAIKLSEARPDIIEKVEEKEAQEKVEQSAASQLLSIKKQKTKINIRIDNTLYAQMMRICSQRGMSCNSTINNLVFQFVQENQEYLK